MTTSRPVESCQVCGAPDLASVFFLGFIPPVNSMPAIGSLPVEQTAYPLELRRCDGCTLVQVGLEVDPDVLFPPDYPYRSASTKILRDNFAGLAAETADIVGFDEKDLVIDIGSNDGTLLSNFLPFGVEVLGVEPSTAAEEADRNGIRSRMMFFTEEAGSTLKSEFGAAKLVTAANVFAHMPDVPRITRGITDLLTDDGVFVSESHYLLDLIRTVQYDTVYHEHLRYYSLRSISFLLDMCGLEVFHAHRIPTHGGSIRVYAARPGTRPISDDVSALLDEEDSSRLTSGEALPAFRRKVLQSKLDLYALLAPLRGRGDRVFGIGAPSRASTLINYVGLDDAILDCVCEISTSAKLNKYIPGTRIPVVDEERLFEEQPEYALLLSWHISDELRSNLRRKGFRGSFITPLPEPTVLDE